MCICVNCGNTFEKKGSAKTCSPACSKENFKKYKSSYDKTYKRKVLDNSYSDDFNSRSRRVDSNAEF